MLRSIVFGSKIGLWRPVFLLGQHDNEVNDVISCNVTVKFLILMFVTFEMKLLINTSQPSPI